MKKLSHFALAFVLFCMFSLSSYPAPASASVSASLDALDKGADTVEKILKMLEFDGERNAVVINKTNGRLIRVGTDNEISSWPIGDVEAKSAVTANSPGSQPGNLFSNVANYRVEDASTPTYFQFGESWPLGSRKINLCAKNESGNAPAESCWNSMTNSNDETMSNNGYRARAMIKSLDKKDGKKIGYVFEVTKD